MIFGTFNSFFRCEAESANFILRIEQQVWVLPSYDHHWSCWGEKGVVLGEQWSMLVRWEEIMSLSMKQKRKKYHIWDTEKWGRRKLECNELHGIYNEVTIFAEIILFISSGAMNCSFQAPHFQISLRFRIEIRWKDVPTSYTLLVSRCSCFLLIKCVHYSRYQLCQL